MDDGATSLTRPTDSTTVWEKDSPDRAQGCFADFDKFRCLPDMAVLRYGCRCSDSVTGSHYLASVPQAFLPVLDASMHPGRTGVVVGYGIGTTHHHR
jgi:hypothetical protein